MRFTSLKNQVINTLRRQNRADMLEDTLPRIFSKHGPPIGDPHGYWSVSDKKKLRNKLNQIGRPERVSIYRHKDGSERLKIAGTGGKPLTSAVMDKLTELSADVSIKTGNYIIIEHEIIAQLLELNVQGGKM